MVNGIALRLSQYILAAFVHQVAWDALEADLVAILAEID